MRVKDTSRKGVRDKREKSSPDVASSGPDNEVEGPRISFHLKDIFFGGKNKVTA